MKSAIANRATDKLFSKVELSVLRRHFEFLNSLSEESREPQTEGQVRFVEVCRGEREPETEFEQIWVKYQFLTELASKHESLEKEVKELKEKYEGALFAKKTIREKVAKLENTLRSLQAKGLPETTPTKVTGLFITEPEANEILQAFGSQTQYRFLKERIERALRANSNSNSRGDWSSHQTCPACGGAGLGCTICSGTGNF